MMYLCKLWKVFGIKFMENKTNEEIAIEQFLAKDERGGWACGCMGPAVLEELRSISDLRYSLWEYNPGDYEPACRCAMYYVELVNGMYYRIKEIKTTKSIEFEAILIGPRGGPYALDRHGDPIKKPGLVKTSADRIKELKGEIPEQEIKFMPLQERAALVDELASNPRNVKWKSKCYSMDLNGKRVNVKKEVINGKFVTSIDGKIVND